MQEKSEPTKIENAHTDALIKLIKQSEIPEIIKSIPKFDGNPKRLHFWISHVKDALSIFQDFKDTPFYRIYLHVIRSKLIGEAANVIWMRNVALDWNEMESTLIECFEDRRSLQTLIFDLDSSRQGHKTLKEFYNEMMELSGFIAQKIKMDPRFAKDAKVVISFVDIVIALFFVKGLNGRISPIILRNPETLVEAYHAAIEYQHKEELEYQDHLQAEEINEQIYQQGEQLNNQEFSSKTMLLNGKNCKINKKKK